MKEEFNLSEKIEEFKKEVLETEEPFGKIPVTIKCEGFIPTSFPVLVAIDRLKDYFEDFLILLHKKIKQNNEIGVSEKNNLQIEINKLTGEKLR